LDSKRVFSGSEGHTIEIKEGKLTIKHIGSSEFTCMWTPKGKVAQMLNGKLTFFNFNSVTCTSTKNPLTIQKSIL
jgi:hypothetical protein